jgi:hypothetical protein
MVAVSVAGSPLRNLTLYFLSAIASIVDLDVVSILY